MPNLTVRHFLIIEIRNFAPHTFFHMRTSFIFSSGIFFLGIFILALAGCKSTELLQRDMTTQSMMNEGEGLMRQEKFDDAATLFESAAKRAASQGTSTATYMAGIAHFKAGNHFPAEQWFLRLIRNYPRSKYIADAKYHLAVSYLDSYDEDKMTMGVNSLQKLAVDSRIGAIQQEAQAALKQFLFMDARATFVQKLWETAIPANRKVIAEALAYQLAKSDQLLAAKKVYQELQDRGGKSDYLAQMLGKEENVAEKAKADPDAKVVKIALFLPLYLAEHTFAGMDEIPQKAHDALGFWEGFKIATDTWAAQGGQEVYIKVFDSQRNSILIQNQLRVLDTLQPDIIVGEIYTDASQVIANWARANQVPQLVPFSANPGLIKEKEDFVFLARPTYYTHGRSMATYAAQKLGLKHVGVWSDQRRVTDAISGAFEKRFTELGGKVIRFAIDSVFEDRAQDDIQDHFDDHISPEDSIDGMYIPLSLEEPAGMIMSTLLIEYKEAPMTVMGTPSWERFSLIDSRQKNKLNLTYTSPFAKGHDPAVLAQFESMYKTTFKRNPDIIQTQGYGLGMYLQKLFTNYKRGLKSGEKLAKRIRTLESVKLPYGNVNFEGKQSNQYLPIFQYGDFQIRQVD